MKLFQHDDKLNDEGKIENRSKEKTFLTVNAWKMFKLKDRGKRESKSCV